MSDPFLVFIHIEKCGGITLHNLLHANFKGYISPHPGFQEHLSKEELKWLKRLYPGKVTGIGGHRAGAFQHYEDVIKQPLFYFTFLRDPIKRYLSHLNWQKMIMSKDWTFDSFAN